MKMDLRGMGLSFELNVSEAAVLVYRWERFVKYAAEMSSGGMMYIPRLTRLCRGIQTIFSLLTQQFERLQSLYY
jgi:hypothetical protein